MEKLRGKQGTWTFDEEKVLIDYATGWLASALNKALGRTEVPAQAIAGVEFRAKSSGAKRKGWELRLRLHDRMDPFSATGAAMSGDDPFLLSGDAKTELLAEYHADQIRFIAERAAASGPPSPGIVTRLTAPLPFHIQVDEGTAAFDGSQLIFTWSGTASSEKRSAQRRQFALAQIEKLEWVPSDGWDTGVLRVVPPAGTPQPKKKVPPKKDLFCLRFEEGAQQSQALLMAATVTAHLWAAQGTGAMPAVEAAAPPTAPALPASEEVAPDADIDEESRVIIARIRKLGELHSDGILTDEEFGAKKAELLKRL